MALPQTICWTAHWNPDRPFTGLEHLILYAGEASSSLIVLPEGREPYRLEFYLHWENNWTIREVRVSVTDTTGSRSCFMTHEVDGQWRNSNGELIEALDGCAYVDIWPSPFTNTFPIRRLNLAAGERREIRIAYVEAPELTVTPVMQAYTRLSEHTYRFESLDDSFQADLEVDSEGIVVDYPGLFRRAY